MTEIIRERRPPNAATRKDRALKAVKAVDLASTEADRLAGDLANNVNKAERAYAAQERSAMRLQLQHQSRDYS